MSYFRLQQSHPCTAPFLFLAHSWLTAVAQQYPFLPHHICCIQQSLFKSANKSDKFCALTELGLCVCSWHAPALPGRPELRCGRHLLSVPSFCPVTPRGHVCSYVMESGHSSHQFCDPQRESSAQSPPSGARGSISSPSISQPPYLGLTESHFPRLPLCGQKGFLPAAPSQQECDLGSIPLSGLQGP